MNAGSGNAPFKNEFGLGDAGLRPSLDSRGGCLYMSWGVGLRSVKFLSQPYPLFLMADSFLVGTWLSLVEHSLGVRGVGSSNLPVPTILDFCSLGPAPPDSS
jgi:hypothetical protein